MWWKNSTSSGCSASQASYSTCQFLLVTLTAYWILQNFHHNIRRTWWPLNLSVTFFFLLSAINKCESFENAIFSVKEILLYKPIHTQTCLISSCDFIGVITVIEVIIDFQFLAYRSKECRVQLPFLIVGKRLLSEKSLKC